MIWFRHITEATEAYKAREGKHKNPESSVFPDSDSSVPDSSSTSSKLPNDEGLEGETSSSSVETESGNATLSPATPGAPLDARAIACPSPTPTEKGIQQKAGVGSPSTVRRFQRVEILKIAEGSQLISPSEVVVSHGPATILTAEPVLTPIERLRRKDAEIQAALKEKQALVADILQVPASDYEHIVDMALHAPGDKDARELILSSIEQAKLLEGLLNESLRISDEVLIAATSSEASTAVAPSPGGSGSRKANRLPSIPTHRILSISATISSQLTQLLHVVAEREEERERLRKEVKNSREQLHLLLEQKLPSSSPQVLPASSSPAETQNDSPDASPLRGAKAEGDEDEEETEEGDPASCTSSKDRQSSEDSSEAYMDASSSSSHSQSQPVENLSEKAEKT
ncbi:unnamed protein product [Darwinula stevensoni]|uniref:Uncharacterized protein n=1 Tax=Darwinula stevensoni TaxID=69355 RepID=A0A7R9A608_9CRUS|nr:unnamed protein product [Darwinula stevensoni]CAG0893132.1 unnamed protein product [Darwinula stevensoni]